MVYYLIVHTVLLVQFPKKNLPPSTKPGSATGSINGSKFGGMLLPPVSLNFRNALIINIEPNGHGLNFTLTKRG